MQDVSGGDAGPVGDARFDPVCKNCFSRDYDIICIESQTRDTIRYLMHCNSCGQDYIYNYTAD